MQQPTMPHAVMNFPNVITPISNEEIHRRYNELVQSYLELQTENARLKNLLRDAEFDRQKSMLRASEDSKKSQGRPPVPLPLDSISREISTLQFQKLSIQNLAACFDQYEKVLMPLFQDYGTGWLANSSMTTSFYKIRNLYDIMQFEKSTRDLPQEQAISLLMDFFSEHTDLKVYKMNSRREQQLVKARLASYIWRKR